MKGMVYTTFALVASSVLLVLSFLSLSGPAEVRDSEAQRITSASFFQESMLNDMEKTLELGTERALASITNFVVTNGEGVSDAERKIVEGLVNGTIEEPGEENVSMKNASLKEWESEIEQIGSRAGYGLEVKLRDYSLNTTVMTVETSYEVFSRLQDPVTLASFNRSRRAKINTSISGLEDTMITLRSGGSYLSSFRRCSFDDPADKLMEADQYSETNFHGEAALNPSNPGSISDKDERILAVDDVDGYSSVENEFRGVVSADPNSSSLGNDDYAVDTGSLSGVEENMSLTVSNGSVWRTGFRQMFKSEETGGCYIVDNDAPGFLQRLENKIVSAEKEGVTTLLNLERLDLAEEGRSSVDYVYFNDSSHTPRKIAGVTDEYDWFRLDQEHVDEWGVNSLVK